MNTKSPLIKDPHFLDWFVGFGEGDGCWVNASNYELWQHRSDLEVLTLCNSNLNLGKIINPEYRPTMSIFSVTRKAEIEELLAIYRTRVRTLNNKERLERFFKLSIETVKPSIEDAWLSGFIDAEGCFRVKYEGDKTVKLIFEITQKSRNIIDLIKSILNANPNVRLTQGVYSLAISSEADRKSLVEYLEKFPLRSHKLSIYKLWKEMHDYKVAGTLDAENYRHLSNTINKWRKK